MLLHLCSHSWIRSTFSVHNVPKTSLSVHCHLLVMQIITSSLKKLLVSTFNMWGKPKTSHWRSCWTHETFFPGTTYPKCVLDWQYLTCDSSQSTLKLNYQSPYKLQTKQLTTQHCSCTHFPHLTKNCLYKINTKRNLGLWNAAKFVTLIM